MEKMNDDFIIPYGDAYNISGFVRRVIENKIVLDFPRGRQQLLNYAVLN